MPFAIEFVEADRLVVLRAPADVTLADFDRAFADMLADARFSRTYDRLWDLRPARRVLEPDEVRELREIYGRYMDAVGGRRTAVLVNSDAYFGMARMFASTAENPAVEFAVFRDESDALSWATGGRGEGD